MSSRTSLPLLTPRKFTSSVKIESSELNQDDSSYSDQGEKESKSSSHINYQFVSDAMSSSFVLDSAKLEAANPFKLFKDSYLDRRSRINFCLLQDYFHFDGDAKFLISRDEFRDCDELEGVTISGCQNSSLSEEFKEKNQIRINIFPQIILFTKSTEQLKTFSLIHAHIDCFKTILRKYQKGSLSNLYVNIFKIVESYVSVIFKDLVIKWIQWIRIVKEIDDNSRISMRILTSKLSKQFWGKHFLLNNASFTSIDMFNENLCQTDTEFDLQVRSKMKFGVWIDSKNGIIIYANNVNVGENFNHNIHRNLSTSGDCIVEAEIKDITNKFFFFLHTSIVQCFRIESTLQSND